MSNDISLAIQLMLVGMLSVFFILGMVVLLGRVLILLVNRFGSDILENPQRNILIDKKKLAILNSAVEMITHGKGVIQSVKKLE